MSLRASGKSVFSRFFPGRRSLGSKQRVRIILALLAALSVVLFASPAKDSQLAAASVEKMNLQQSNNLIIHSQLQAGSSPHLPLLSLTATQEQSLIDGQQLMQQGRELFQSEQFAAGATVWQQAAAAFQVQGDKLNEALALSYLSLAYQKQGKWQQATAAITASLSILQTNQYGGATRERLSVLAQALNTQAHLQLALGQSEQALSTWQRATTSYTQTDDQEGIIGSQINQAQAMQALGLYRRARQSLEEVETKLQSQPNSLVKSTALRSLGNALRVIGNLDKSREVLQQSLTIAQQLRSPADISAGQFSLANTLRAFAQRAADVQDTSTVKNEIQATLNAYQQAAQVASSPIMKVQAQLNQLSLLVDTQQLSTALALRSSIQSNLSELPASRSSIYARINFAESLTRLKQQLGNGDTKSSIPQSLSPGWSDIAQILATAVEEARGLKDQRAESYALGNLGHLYELTGQPPHALTLTQQSLTLAQAINASDIAYRWQWQLGRLLKAQGDSKGAIAAYEVAFNTLQTLRSDLVAVNPDNPDVQFSFRESVEPIYRELVRLLLQSSPDGKGELSQDNLRQARQVIESLQLAELDNFFQEACLDAKPVQIDQVDSQAAVLYPIILQDRLEVILALPQSPLRHYTIPKPQHEVESLLNELQQDIGRLAANRQQVLRQSQQVYDWLIRPAEAELKQHNVQTLVFVLDGLLRNVPMAALHDGQQYLIEKYSIALTPGLQLLAPQPLAKSRLSVLTVGLSEARQGFPPLPNVVRELEQIKSQMSSRVLLNREFTANNLQTALNLSAFPIVHVATHGEFSSQAEKTFILTWDGKINVKDLNKLLRTREKQVSHPIELLVFSACETADGDNRAALGLAGVAVRAGARSTLATLWKVSDESTAALMVRFYKELARPGVTKAEALRRAQQSLLQNNTYRLPYFWAPYVLVGNWR